MDERECWVAALGFGNPDRVPLCPGGGRESTLRTWHSQGLPESLTDIGAINEYAYRQAGGQLAWPKGGGGFPVEERMIPQFDEKVIERRERSQVVQDWKGNICEIGHEYSVEYLRNAIDFVTRRWIKCPVETRADWESMKERYDPEDPCRFPENAAALGRQLAARRWPVQIHFSGPFWQAREWLGFENLCMLFLDDPEFLREMIEFWGEYVSRLLERTFQWVVPDMVHISEDMAFKAHSMVSPAMVREFLFPVYARWGEILRSAGCRFYAMDSDGYVGELIPIWIDAGINVCDPMEVAAGNDIVAYRRDYGEKMAFQCGIDKRAMAAGGTVIEREIRRVTPVIRSGGYIPGCDHGVPADVAWPDYVRYVGMLARATGWL